MKVTRRPTVAVIQARMGSSRLPGKMMLHLHGHPLIEWVYRRACSAQRLDAVVVAIPDTPLDAVLGEYLHRMGADVFVGSECDVLGRFTAAAEYAGAGVVVRVCADNPLVSGTEIDALVDFFANDSFDYAYNHVPRDNRYADGLGAEIGDIELLRTLDARAVESAHREHVFDYLWGHPEEFHIGTFDPPDPRLAHPHVRLDVDTAEDFIGLMRLPLSIDIPAADAVAAALEAVPQEERQ